MFTKPYFKTGGWAGNMIIANLPLGGTLIANQRKNSKVGHGRIRTIYESTKPLEYEKSWHNIIILKSMTVK